MFRFLALLLLLLPARTFGVTYYVSALGNDTNSGLSLVTPWATIAKVNATMLHAGDSVLFRGGDTFVGNLVIAAAGTPLEPIIVGSYGTGRAIINGESGTGIMVYDVGGVAVENIIAFSPDRLLNKGSGIEFYNDLAGDKKLAYVRVYNVVANGFGTNGIAVIGNASDGSQSGYTNVLINQAVVSNNALTGILVFSFHNPTTTFAHSNVQIINSVAHDNTGIPGYNNHSGDGIFIEDVNGGSIKYSLAYNNGTLDDYPGGGMVGIWAAISNNVTIQYCESHHNHGAIDGDGFDLDGGTTNSVLEYNYSHDNDGHGYLVFDYAGAPLTTGHNTVRYNISQNDGVKANQASINVGGVMTGPTEIYNNTLYNSSVGAVVFQNEGSSDVHFRNNILISAGATLLVSAHPTPGSVLEGNDYWSTTATPRFYWGTNVYSSYSAWRTASKQETLNGVDVGLAVNPLLVNAGGGQTINNSHNLAALGAYRLQAGSPVIDKALNLFLLFGISTGARDFYGVSVPQNLIFDMGASEWTQ